mgnify:CR=1 FL=1
MPENHPLQLDETGKLQIVERGFLNLDYRDGLAKADPSTGKWLRVDVRLICATPTC